MSREWRLPPLPPGEGWGEGDGRAGHDSFAAILRVGGMLSFLLSTCLVGAQERPHPDPLPMGEGEGFGKTVVSVAYTTDGPVDPAQVSRLIEVMPGRPLTDDATSATIRNLFATRRFSDIRIEAQDVPGGVAVTVELFRAYRVWPLKFSSAPGLARGAAPRRGLRRGFRLPGRGGRAGHGGDPEAPGGGGLPGSEGHARSLLRPGDLRRKGPLSRSKRGSRRGPPRPSSTGRSSPTPPRCSRSGCT